MLFSTSLFAEWTKVTGSADGDMTVYVDSDSIKKKGNKVTMLTLLDYKVVQVVYPNHNSYKSAANYLSDVNHKEYDCENKKSRLLDLYRYSGNMREGEIVNSQSNIKMKGTSVLPRSMEEDVFKIACGNELMTINENIVINTLFGVFVDEDIRMAVIFKVGETFPSALFFWWVTYYFMIKRKKIIVKKHKILTHFIIILLILTFLYVQDINSLTNGFFGVVAIVLSIISCLILKKSPSNK